MPTYIVNDYKKRRQNKVMKVYLFANSFKFLINTKAVAESNPVNEK